jgi:hypothetical protein
MLPLDFSLVELRDLEMLHDYIFGNESLKYIGIKYNLKNPFNNIKTIAIRIGLIDSNTFNKGMIQNKSELYNQILQAMEEKKKFQNTLDDILLG